MNALQARYQFPRALGPLRGLRTRVVAITLVLTIILLAVVLAVRGGPALFLIEARTGSIEYVVARVETAAFRVHDAEIRGQFPDGCRLLTEGTRQPDTQQVTASIEPRAGSKVTYWISGETMYVTVRWPTSPATDNTALATVAQGSASCVATDFMSIKVPRAGVADAPISTFPIAGPATMGRQMSGVPAPDAAAQPLEPYLMGGTISIFGRTAFKAISDSLYPAANATFRIPAGSQISTLGGDGTTDLSSVLNSWYGIVVPEDGLLSVSATTDTSELRFYRPGARSDYEVLEGSLFSRLFGDPSFAIVSFAVLGFSIVLQIVLAWFNTCESNSRGGHLKSERKQQPQLTPGAQDNAAVPEAQSGVIASEKSEGSNDLPEPHAKA